VRQNIDLQEFEKLLKKLKDVTLSVHEGHERAAGTVELDQSKVGRISRMDALQQQAMSAAVGRRARQELDRIESALRRITNGEYGFCVGCGEEIAVKRPRANPSVLTCITCARSAEKR
jgi:DnaK suppressor protein